MSLICADGLLSLGKRTIGGSAVRKQEKAGVIAINMKEKVEETTVRSLSDKDLLQRRDELRRKITQENAIQMAKKIQLNSAYGALSNQYFRWFDPKLAEAITLSGQLSVRHVANHINRFLNDKFGTSEDYVVGIDTDSNYVKLEHIVEIAKQKGLKDNESDIINLMDRFCQDILTPEIAKAYDELKENMNAFEQKMFMKREALASDVVWTGKKRYAMLVWDNEGVRYHTPQLKVVGIEAVRSSTPKACRKKIEEALYIILGGKQEELWEFIKDFKKDFPKLPFLDITFNVSINNLEVYNDSSTIYKKGTPIYTRGALLYNHYLEKFGLTNKYKQLQNGDKAHYIYLRIPNPIQENIITVPDNIPEEFGLDDFIDYDMQFEKSFLSPLKTIVDAAGWTLEKTNTLDSFFT